MHWHTEGHDEGEASSSLVCNGDEPSVKFLDYMENREGNDNLKLRSSPVLGSKERGAALGSKKKSKGSCSYSHSKAEENIERIPIPILYRSRIDRVKQLQRVGLDITPSRGDGVAYTPALVDDTARVCREEVEEVHSKGKSLRDGQPDGGWISISKRFQVCSPPLRHHLLDSVSISSGDRIFISTPRQGVMP